MSRFTKEQRQKIVREFAIRHNGTFNAALFLEEVRSTGESHEAYSWFEWDRDKAFQQYQLEQAREFARDLRVTFKVEEVTGRKPIKVREAPMPLVISPMASRNSGGGYRLVEPDDATLMAEHCAQASITLRGWKGRYEACLLKAGVSLDRIDSIIAALDVVSAEAVPAA